MLFIVKYLRKISGIKKHIGWLLADLIVVFVGVYAAFLITEYAAERKHTQHQKKLYEAIYQDIDGFIDVNWLELESWYKEWQQHYEDGQMPDLIYLPVEKGFIPPSRDVWNAAVASDVLGALEASTVRNIAQFYNRIDHMLKKFESLNEFVLREIIPHEERGKAPFYNLETHMEIVK